jgi:hypothetical protein
MEWRKMGHCGGKWGVMRHFLELPNTGARGKYLLDQPVEHLHGQTPCGKAYLWPSGPVYLSEARQCRMSVPEPDWVQMQGTRQRRDI